MVSNTNCVWNSSLVWMWSIYDWILGWTWMNDLSKAPFLQWYPFLFDFRRVSGFIRFGSTPQRLVWPVTRRNLPDTWRDQVISWIDVNINPKGTGIWPHKRTRTWKMRRIPRSMSDGSHSMLFKIGELSPLSYDLTDKLVEPVPLGSQDGLSFNDVASPSITDMLQTYMSIRYVDELIEGSFYYGPQSHKSLSHGESVGEAHCSCLSENKRHFNVVLTLSSVQFRTLPSNRAAVTAQLFWRQLVLPHLHWGEVGNWHCFFHWKLFAFRSCWVMLVKRPRVKDYLASGMQGDGSWNISWKLPS